MSYGSDWVESVYMVEFESGRTIHVSFYELQEVKQYCEDEHIGEVIKIIYKEVYVIFITFWILFYKLNGGPSLSIQFPGSWKSQGRQAKNPIARLRTV